jgi:hypothetical protein
MCVNEFQVRDVGPTLAESLAYIRKWSGDPAMIARCERLLGENPNAAVGDANVFVANYAHSLRVMHDPKSVYGAKDNPVLTGYCSNFQFPVHIGGSEKTVNPPSERSLQLAAQAWCKSATRNMAMIPELAEAFARIIDEEAEIAQRLRSDIAGAFNAAAGQATEADHERYRGSVIYQRVLALRQECDMLRASIPPPSSIDIFGEDVRECQYCQATRSIAIRYRDSGMNHQVYCGTCKRTGPTAPSLRAAVAAWNRDWGLPPNVVESPPPWHVVPGTYIPTRSDPADAPLTIGPYFDNAFIERLRQADEAGKRRAASESTAEPAPAETWRDRAIRDPIF